MAILKIGSSVAKSVIKKPATRAYPKEARPSFKGARGQIAINLPLCIFCGMCKRKCPTGAIEVNLESKIWKIDYLRCVTCNACVEVCPKKCLTMEMSFTKPMSAHEKPG